MDGTQFGNMQIVSNTTDNKQAEKKQKTSNCPDVNAFAGYLDNKLAESDKSAVEQHMATCGDCRTNLYEIRMLMDSEQKDAPDELVGNVKKNIHNVLDAPTPGRKIKV